MVGARPTHGHVFANFLDKAQFLRKTTNRVRQRHHRRVTLAQKQPLIRQQRSDLSRDELSANSGSIPSLLLKFFQKTEVKTSGFRIRLVGSRKM